MYYPKLTTKFEISGLKDKISSIYSFYKIYRFVRPEEFYMKIK